MQYSQSQNARHEALEHLADRLLELFPADTANPAYPEKKLNQRGRHVRVFSVHELSDMPVAEPQEFRDELKFLMSVTRLHPDYRRCMQLWAEGWSQMEIALAFRVQQQTVSYRLRRALRACYDSVPISFRRFCHHTIYRRPGRTGHGRLRRVCVHCGEPIATETGCSRFCSVHCREANRHFGQ